MNLNQFLLQNGPYAFTVKITSSEKFHEVMDWLRNRPDLKEYQDWEMLDRHAPPPHKDRNGTLVVAKDRRWYFFFNDNKIASYVRITWG